MNAIWAIAWKDLRLLLRDKGDLFWVIGFPILIAFFFGSIGGGGGDHAALPIAVVDQDRTAYSRAIVSRLKSSDGLKATEAPLDSARLLVRKGDLVAYVALLPGTSETFGFGGDSTRGIEIGVDPRRSAEREYLRGLVTAAIFQSMRGSFAPGGGGRDLIEQGLGRLRDNPSIDPERRGRQTRLLHSLESFLTVLDSTQASTGVAAGTDPGGGGPNLRVVEMTESDSGPRSAYEVTFPSSIAWALIGVCMSFAISIVYERITGTFLRLRLAPIGRAQILAGKGLASFLASLAAVTIVLALGVVLFHVRISNPVMLAAAVACSAFCFTGVMMVVATLGKTPPSVAGAGWAIMMVMSMTGGGMIPLVAMPAWMQTVSNFSIVKYAVLSVEGAVWRGFDWSEMLPVLAVPLAVGLAGIVIGTRVLQSRDL
jgi:linearmycin/streptolysin S transport system permease protein